MNSHEHLKPELNDLRGSEFSSYDTELHKITSHFELQTQKIFIESLLSNY